VTITPPRSDSAFRPSRAVRRLLLSVVLAAAAVPALAQQVPSSSLAGDSADAPAPVTRATLPEAMTFSDRALLLATDLNRLLAPGASGDIASAPAAEQGRIKTVMQRALALLGTPYRWGGTDPDKGFDCSGLVGYVFRNALGIELPRVSREMAKTGELVTDKAKLAAGDLVFFGRRGRVDHVGIYVGEGQFVHAPSRGKDVQVSSLDTGYWSGKFMQARRVDGI
jgi:cell wall-associated NlpC family hydrolase